MYDRKEELERNTNRNLLNRKEQSQCSHIWEPTIYNPEKRWFHMDAGFLDKVLIFGQSQKDIGKRTCLVGADDAGSAGKVEYTYKQKPIISDYEADFS